MIRKILNLMSGDDDVALKLIDGRTGEVHTFTEEEVERIDTDNLLEIEPSEAGDEDE